MEQLTLFDFPDEPTTFKSPIAAIPQGKWDAWWIQLLCRARNQGDDSDDGAEPSESRVTAKQEPLPGML
jgi:hypothetical protein